MPDSRSAASNSPAEPTTWYRGVVTLHVYTETMIRRSLYTSLHGCYTLQDFSYFPNCFMTFTHKSLIKHTQRLQVLRVVWVVQLVVEGCAKGGQLHSQLLSMGALQSWTDDLVLSLHQLHIPHISQHMPTVLDLITNLLTWSTHVLKQSRGWVLCSCSRDRCFYWLCQLRTLHLIFHTTLSWLSMQIVALWFYILKTTVWQHIPSPTAFTELASKLQWGS
jgi:hypothetical protein